MQESLTIPERHLMALVPTLHEAKRILVAGNRSGELPFALCVRFPEAEFQFHAFDCHHAHQISARLYAGGFEPEPLVVCSPAIPEGPWDLAFFQTTPRSMSAELVLDQLQDMCLKLAEGGVLYAAFEGDPDEALKTVKRVFKSVHVPFRDKKSILLKAVRTGVPARLRDFAATWQASVPGGAPLTFTSYPGCFCHRRADAGGLALAEVAVREARPGQCLLDMGCGCGLVGLLVLDALRRQNAEASSRLVLVDSHARALAAAEVNAQSFGLMSACRFELSDTGLSGADSGMCDLALANPPYYGDWQIAETFLRTARATLKKGGVCLAVAKAEQGLGAIQREVFGSYEVIPRRGYAILRSVKR